MRRYPGAIVCEKTTLAGVPSRTVRSRKRPAARGPARARTHRGIEASVVAAQTTAPGKNPCLRPVPSGTVERTESSRTIISSGPSVPDGTGFSYRYRDPSDESLGYGRRSLTGPNQHVNRKSPIANRPTPMSLPCRSSVTGRVRRGSPSPPGSGWGAPGRGSCP